MAFEQIRVLHAIIRIQDIFGRIGGEEFLLALVKTPIDIASNLAERIRLSTESMTIKGPDFNFGFTVSIGITSIEEGDISLEKMQDRCDKALYQAKNKGRNRVVLFKHE